MLRTTGTVKFFNPEKGYGFVSVPGHKDVFVHQRHVRTEIGRELISGDFIEFDVEVTERGFQSINVDIVKAYDVSSGPVLSPGGSILSNDADLDVDVDEHIGIFVPTMPANAARVLANYFDEHEIQELTDCLLVGID